MSALHTPTELRQATVGDVMHRGVITCAPDARLTTVAATMAAHAVHAAVLLGPRRDGALVVTDLDVIRAALNGRFEATAAEVVREPLLCVAANAPLEQAISLMATRDESAPARLRSQGRLARRRAVEPRRDGGAVRP